MEAKENVAEEVLFEPFMSVYWITKQEIPIRKLVPLLQLVQKVAVPRLKCIFLQPASYLNRSLAGILCAFLLALHAIEDYIQAFSFCVLQYIRIMSLS